MPPTDDPHFELSSHASERTASSPFSERLRRSVADLVLETTAESIWLIDGRARTTFVNRHMANLLGYTEQEMIGRPVFDFLERSYWQVAEQNLHKRKLGLEDRREVPLIRKDGTRVWAIASANPVFDREGQYAGALALLGDLTPQKDRERLLQEQVARLRAQSPRPARPSDEPAPVREPFKAILAMAVLGTFLATVAVTTAGAVIGSALGSSGGRRDDV